VSFIPPMLCSRSEGPDRLADRRYVAESKLDGQRAQVHVREGRTVACYSRPGRDLLRHPGVAWLRMAAWPLDAALLDGGSLCGRWSRGHPGGLEERNRIGGDMSFMAFDLLKLDGQDVMREPWRDRRKRLENVFANVTPPGRPRPCHGGCRDPLRNVGRLGWRGHRAEGTDLDLQPWHSLARLAQGEAETCA
jgi:bifunctional non-homologous end joining protein LigD